MSAQQQPERMRGVLSPVVTPFDRRLSPGWRPPVRHCQWLLSQDVGLAVFGTTPRATRFRGEKIGLLDQLVAAGVPPHG